jgi:CRP-like cAMP-binding protein
MKNILVNYFSKISQLSADEKKAIADSMVTRDFKKGTFLLREGQLSVDTYFILQGCIREFIVSDGDEKTTNFFTEEQWLISLNNFRPNNPTIHNWVCVEDTTLVVGNEEKAQAIFKKFPRFETISRVVMEAAFSEQVNVLTSYLTDSPEQRYLKLLKARPALFQRVPQYQIASYIGVKPESLSRIRKRVLQKH